MSRDPVVRMYWQFVTEALEEAAGRDFTDWDKSSLEQNKRMEDAILKILPNLTTARRKHEAQGRSGATSPLRRKVV